MTIKSTTFIQIRFPIITKIEKMHRAFLFVRALLVPATGVVTWQRGRLPTASCFCEVDLTRNKFCEALNLLFQTELEPLRQTFLSDSVAAVDEVIDFLSVDIPAFRCGYEKEWYLRRLKSLPLTENQKERLKNIALDLCRKPAYRREFPDWARLMIMLADETFVDELQALLESPDLFVRKKADRVLKIIPENRKDLIARRLVLV